MKTALELAQLVSGTIDGDPALPIAGVAGLEHAQQGQLSFYGNNKYKKALAATKASAVLVPLDQVREGATTYIRVAQPHLAFARIARHFHPEVKHSPQRSAQAFIDSTAQVPASATVMANVTIGPRAKLGERVVCYPGVFVGADVCIGDDTVLMPNVTVLDRCLIGARCLLQPSAVIGADGFGFALDASVPEHVKIPQAGIVRIEDDVEIGACSCVDRATTGETVVAKGAKLDNLVQVGHNSVVGPLSILCAQVGLAGSSILGTGVVLAGQVGVSGHLRIGDLAKAGGQAGIVGDVEAQTSVMGTPAMPFHDFMRSWAVVGRLPQMQKELRALQRRLERLEHPSSSTESEK